MTKLYSNRSPVNLDLQLFATPWVAGGGGRMRDASLSADVPTDRAYDGMWMIQVRDENHAPLVSYTWGTDLSGSQEGLPRERALRSHRSRSAPSGLADTSADSPLTLSWGEAGIGGLLARSNAYHGPSGRGGTRTITTTRTGTGTSRGNITYLVNTNQGLAASYRYDPYGNTISSSGTLARANVYRFSSKELHAAMGKKNKCSTPPPGPQSLPPPLRVPPK